MVRRRREEVHVNQERWLISYADFITLLFAFFVVMYSISQVSDSKYRVLSDTFVEAFNQPTNTQTNTEPNESASTTATVIPPIVENQVAPVINDQAANAKPDIELEKLEQPIKTSDELTQISDLVTEKFTQLINDQMIQISSNELWLQIELKDSILFSSGSADTSEQAQKIFDEIAGILKNYSNPIQVEGFTDNIPINSAKYPTNWELSTARASAIVKYLASRGVEPERLSAVGYGEYQPIATNDTDQGRAQNRRVAIMVAKRKMDRPKINSVQIAPVPASAASPSQ
ncbi:MAG TPA: flagellar motor protein MotD [Cellvibrio sp.]|nr:flagellar motor protein MotD [Cellvibrio sp.]